MYECVLEPLNRTRNSLLAGKQVISRPLWEGSLSFGGEYSNNSRTNIYHNEEGVLDNDDSKIKEELASGFLKYGRSSGKLGVQAGVRYEHVGLDYYDKVFASLTLSPKVGI